MTRGEKDEEMMNTLKTNVALWGRWRSLGSIIAAL